MKTQNLFRKIVATMLALVIMVGANLLAVSDIWATSTDSAVNDTSSSFIDISPMDWFYEQVRYVYEHGLMTGTDAVTFSPNMPVTRAMAVQVLFNHGHRQISAGVARNPFTDVAKGAWYHDAVVWAANMGIVSGVGDGIFAPRNYVTRAHLAVILNNYANIMGLEFPVLRASQPFADDMDIRSYAREAIDRFFMAMIINGRPDGTFNPQGNVARAELASMLSGFVKLSENLLNGGDDFHVVPGYDYEEHLPQPPYGFPELPPQPPYGFPEPIPHPDYDFPWDEIIVPMYGFPGCEE